MSPFRRTLLERFERVVGIFAVQRFQVGGRNRLLHSRAARSRIREEAQRLKRLTGDAIYAGENVVPHNIVGGDVVGPRLAGRIGWRVACHHFHGLCGSENRKQETDERCKNNFAEFSLGASRAFWVGGLPE